MENEIFLAHEERHFDATMQVVKDTLDNLEIRQNLYHDSVCSSLGCSNMCNRIDSVLEHLRDAISEVIDIMPELGD